MSFIDLFAKGQHSSVSTAQEFSPLKLDCVQMNATNSRFSAEHVAFRRESRRSEQSIYRLFRLTFPDNLTCCNSARFSDLRQIKTIPLIILYACLHCCII